MSRLSRIRTFSLLTVALCATVPFNASAATDHATLTIARNWFGGACQNLIFTSGSYSPTGLTGGKTVNYVLEIDCQGTFVSASIQISGFAIDPGQAWITSMTCNGVTKTGASATSFSYGSGKGTWLWNTSFGLYTLPVSTNVSCSITHP